MASAVSSFINLKVHPEPVSDQDEPHSVAWQAASRVVRAGDTIKPSGGETSQLWKM